VGVDFGIDLDEIRRVIDAADVLVVRLSVTDRRLLVDARISDEHGPMIKVVPPAASAEERFRSLKMMRPRFRVPERILTFQWPRHARALSESGIWDHIAHRLVALGRAGTAAQCDQAYRELLEEERKVEVAAIKGGEGFQTLWASDQRADD
jgi:hypothetical protein